MGLFSFLSQEVAIDLGTANTNIIANDKLVVDEPSIVAIDRKRYDQDDQYWPQAIFSVA
jgi:rod shape-determining protein MreB